MFPALLIGLREGLEAALVVGILVAYLRRLGRKDAVPKLLAGVVLAILLSLLLGAVLTFGPYTLAPDVQELIGGLLSLLAVAMVTWMIFWMQRAGRTMKATLEGGVDRALTQGGIWALIAIGFVSVAREGLETTLLLWSLVLSFGGAPTAILGAVLGLVIAAVIGWLITRGAVRLDLRRFFTWTGGFLVIVAAGVLAYAIMDLQEAAVLPGPFTALATLDPLTGRVATGWGGFPFGYAFDVSSLIAPGSTLAALLQATIGFTPVMTWLQVIAWAVYIVVVGSLYIRGIRSRRPASARPSALPPVAESTTGDASSLTKQGAP